MASLKMPEVNTVLIAGNLTKDPTIRRTGNGIPVTNFCIASNRKYRDANNHWAEDVCYAGVVAWSRLAESCLEKLRKGSAVLVDGELQSRTWHGEDGTARTVVEIKAHRIQFLNKQEYTASDFESAEELYFDEAILDCGECADPAKLSEDPAKLSEEQADEQPEGQSAAGGSIELTAMPYDPQAPSGTTEKSAVSSLKLRLRSESE